MAKRTAGKELTQENWAEEEDHEEMGTFRQASAEQLANRNFRKAKRRGTNGDSSGPSIFKGLPVLAGFGTTSEVSTQPTFSFLNSSKASSENGSGGFGLSPKSEKLTEKTTQPLRITQGSLSLGIKRSDSKSNGFMENRDTLEADGKKDSLFLSNLKALNDGVLVWIQKHLDKNPHVNLSPVFDDYKKHYSELLKKYPPEMENGKEDSESLPSSSRKDVASGKENNPLPELLKENTPIKPFSFGIQSLTSDKSAEGSKMFSFSVTNSSDKEKKTDAPTFTFSGSSSLDKKSEGLTFGSKNSEVLASGSKNSEGLAFGNTNSESLAFGSKNSESLAFGSNNSEGIAFGSKTSEGFTFGSSSGSSGFSFGGLSSQPVKLAGVGFSFAGSTSTVTDKKEDSNQTEEANDEPPKVEVNEIKEEGAFYDKKCKLFYMKDGAYVDRGVGTLYLKAAGEKTQLLIRAFTNLGTILLNILLNSSIPTARVGKNGVLLVCIPNPPLEKIEGPVKMLIRVKTSEDADALLEKLNEHKK